MARVLICANHKNVKAIDAIPTTTVTYVSSAIAPSTSNQERIIAKNEIRIHPGHIPRFRKSNIHTKNNAVFFIFCSPRLDSRVHVWTLHPDGKLS